MKMLRWIDRRLWVVPLTLAAVLQVVHWQLVSDWLPHLTSDSTVRSAFFGSVAGSAGAMTGLAIAVVAILISPAQPRSAAVQSARTVSGLLMLSEALLFMLVCALATMGIVVPAELGRPIELELVALTFAALVGLVVGGVALALALVESAPGS